MGMPPGEILTSDLHEQVQDFATRKPDHQAVKSSTPKSRLFGFSLEVRSTLS